MATEEKSLHFIEQIIEENIENGFPSKNYDFCFPIGTYLHIGHAKSYLFKFRIRLKYSAPVNLLLLTIQIPPKKSKSDAIKRRFTWLGFNWDEERYASDYSQQL
jgi:glutaminyl-tRNA synthetase